MTEFDVDDAGQIVGVSHHDGLLESVALKADRVDLGILNSNDGKVEVFLLGVKYFAMNNLREGNIIDRMYLWRLDSAPGGIIKRMLIAMSIDSVEVLRRGIGKEDVHVFHMECSYGADLFALVEGIRVRVGAVS